MSRKVIAVFFLLAWAYQLADRYVVLLDFYLNQDYIAKNFCINRAAPEMHCNGKCQLARKIKEEEKKEKDNPGRKQENRQENSYCAATIDQQIRPALSGLLNTRYPIHLIIGGPTDQPAAIFHPPRPTRII